DPGYIVGSSKDYSSSAETAQESNSVLEVQEYQKEEIAKSGKKCVNVNGKVVAARKVADIDCSKCKLKCHTKFTQEERQAINSNYWSLGSYTRQRDFICQTVDYVPVKKKKAVTANKKERNGTHIYIYHYNNADNRSKEKVCKQFFLRTFDISERTVFMAKKKQVGELSPFVSDGKRGRHPPHHKLSEIDRQGIKTPLRERRRKISAKASRTHKAFTFDLQAVLYSPCSNVSFFYYTHRFCTYDLTVNDQAENQGICFVWNETDGKRGSDDIGTAIFKLLHSLPQTVKNVTFTSDSCGGQNRNRFMAALLLYENKNFKEINLQPSRRSKNLDNSITIKKTFTEPLQIDEKTFSSLITLCNRRDIPTVYHDFYKSLKTNRNSSGEFVNDCVLKSDEEEEILES
ncbi:hypothetical protein ILUMI_15551, partial [Ignelater luminosus]